MKVREERWEKGGFKFQPHFLVCSNWRGSPDFDNIFFAFPVIFILYMLIIYLIRGKISFFRTILFSYYFLSSLCLYSFSPFSSSLITPFLLSTIQSDHNNTLDEYTIRMWYISYMKIFNAPQPSTTLHLHHRLYCRLAPRPPSQPPASTAIATTTVYRHDPPPSLLPP